jgi:hypothetical protein
MISASGRPGIRALLFGEHRDVEPGEQQHRQQGDGDERQVGAEVLVAHDGAARMLRHLGADDSAEQAAARVSDIAFARKLASAASAAANR